MAKKKNKKIRITLIKSPVGRKPNQRKTAVALGLTKLSKAVEQEATPSILGMVDTISHLVKVEEIG